MASSPLPTQLLGPDNWFEAWWLQRAAPTAPQLARDAAGEPAFAALSLNEIGFAEAVLSRLWAAEHDRWDTAESEFLRELRKLHLERALRLRETGGDVTEGRAALTLPALDRIGDRTGWLVDELWRLEQSTGLRAWLAETVSASGFAAAATQDVQRRRLAVTAARLIPSTAIYAVVRAIYRDESTHDAVARADRDFCGSDRQFRDAVLEMGLHTPVRRQPVYAASKRGAADAATAPRVTVLIPSYKHEAFVEAAIRSALDQTLSASTVLVVDDQSPDATLEIARRIADPRLEVRQNEANVGLGTSIHGALGEIDTPYVALLNSDDLFHPERLERCLEVLDADPTAALVATGLDFVDGAGGRLTADTSCVVDVGRKTHGWLMWYERVARELETLDQWTATASLLRHNHLATSSNMVVRTDYLRQQITEVKPLRYCIDWLLFLFAAADGVLRYLPEPLLAYRFHDANTVWFESGGRSDYIFEVNHVLGRALHRIAGRRSAADGPEAAKQELAALLRRHVLQHGESSGFAQLFTDIVGTPTPAGTGGEVDRLAQELMRRKAMAQVLDIVDLPPHDVIRLSRDAARHRVDDFVIEGVLHRSRVQEEQLQRQQAELASRARQLEDAHSRLHDLHAQRDRLSNERDRLSTERDRLSGDRDRLSTERDRLSAERDRLLVERDRIGTERDSLRADVRLSQAEGEEQRRRAEQAERRATALAVETDALAVRVGRLADAVAVSRGLCEAERARSRELRSSAEWRAGQFLLRRMRLLRLWKTLTRAGLLLSVRCRRLLGRPLRRCAVVAWEGAFPAPETRHLVAEARCLLEAGIELRVVCVEAGDPDLLGPQERPLLSCVRVLPQDASLSASDRRFFERRAAETVAELTATYAGEPHVLARLFTFARHCAGLGAGYLHGLGLGESAALVHGAARLLDLPFGLAVAGSDLAILRHDVARAGAILRQAAIVVADSERTAEAVGHAAGKALPALSVKPPAAYWESNGRERSWNGCLHATAAPAGPAWELLTIADAVARAIATGTEVHVDSLSRADPGSSEVLRPHIDARGLLDRFTFHQDAPGALEECLDRASVLIATGDRDDGGAAAVPAAVLAAMAAAVPVVATRGGVLDGLVADAVNGLLVPPGDVDALAQALRALATDAELRARLGRRARQDYLRDYAPAVSAARLRDAVRGFLSE